jgi:hypothetical protein
MPEEVVEWYARGGWRGRLEPYVAYWTEDEELARRAGRPAGRFGRSRGLSPLRRASPRSGGRRMWLRLTASTSRLWRGLWLNT